MSRCGVVKAGGEDVAPLRTHPIVSNSPVSAGRVRCSGCSGALLDSSLSSSPQNTSLSVALTHALSAFLCDSAHLFSFSRYAQAQRAEAFRAGFQAGFQSSASTPVIEKGDTAAAATQTSKTKAAEMKQKEEKVEIASKLKTQKAKAEKSKENADKAAAAATTKQAKKTAESAKELAEKKVVAKEKKVAAAEAQAQEKKAKKQKADEAADQAKKTEEKANEVSNKSSKSSNSDPSRTPPLSTTKAPASKPTMALKKSPNATLKNTTRPFDYHCPKSCSLEGMKGFQPPQHVKLYEGVSDSGIVVKGCSWSCSCSCKCVPDKKGEKEGRYVCDSCMNNGERTALKVDFHASAAAKH